MASNETVKRWNKVNREWGYSGDIFDENSKARDSDGDITYDVLKDQSSFLRAAQHVYAMFQRKKFDLTGRGDNELDGRFMRNLNNPDLSDKDRTETKELLTEYVQDELIWFNTNTVSLIKGSSFTVESASDEEKIAFRYILDLHEETPNFTLDGETWKERLWAMGSDPFNYFTLATFGGATALAQGWKHGAKEAFQDTYQTELQKEFRDIVAKNAKMKATAKADEKAAKAELKKATKELDAAGAQDKTAKTEALNLATEKLQEAKTRTVNVAKSVAESEKHIPKLSIKSPLNALKQINPAIDAITGSPYADELKRAPFAESLSDAAKKAGGWEKTWKGAAVGGTEGGMYGAVESYNMQGIEVTANNVEGFTGRQSEREWGQYALDIGMSTGIGGILGGGGGHAAGALFKGATHLYNNSLLGLPLKIPAKIVQAALYKTESFLDLVPHTGTRIKMMKSLTNYIHFHTKDMFSTYTARMSMSHANLHKIIDPEMFTNADKVFDVHKHIQKLEEQKSLNPEDEEVLRHLKVLRETKTPEELADIRNTVKLQPGVKTYIAKMTLPNGDSVNRNDLRGNVKNLNDSIKEYNSSSQMDDLSHDLKKTTSHIGDLQKSLNHITELESGLEAIQKNLAGMDSIMGMSSRDGEIDLKKASEFITAKKESALSRLDKMSDKISGGQDVSKLSASEKEQLKFIADTRQNIENIWDKHTGKIVGGTSADQQIALDNLLIDLSAEATVQVRKLKTDLINPIKAKAIDDLQIQYDIIKNSAKEATDSLAQTKDKLKPVKDDLKKTKDLLGDINNKILNDMGVMKGGTAVARVYAHHAKTPLDTIRAYHAKTAEKIGKTAHALNHINDGLDKNFDNAIEALKNKPADEAGSVMAHLFKKLKESEEKLEKLPKKIDIEDSLKATKAFNRLREIGTKYLIVRPNIGIVKSLEGRLSTQDQIQQATPFIEPDFRDGEYSKELLAEFKKLRDEGKLPNVAKNFDIRYTPGEDGRTYNKTDNGKSSTQAVIEFYLLGLKKDEGSKPYDGQIAKFRNLYDQSKDNTALEALKHMSVFYAHPDNKASRAFGMTGTMLKEMKDVAHREQGQLTEGKPNPFRLEITDLLNDVVNNVFEYGSNSYRGLRSEFYELMKWRRWGDFSGNEDVSEIPEEYLKTKDAKFKHKLLHIPGAFFLTYSLRREFTKRYFSPAKFNAFMVGAKKGEKDQKGNEIEVEGFYDGGLVGNWKRGTITGTAAVTILGAVPLMVHEYGQMDQANFLTDSPYIDFDTRAPHLDSATDKPYTADDGVTILVDPATGLLTRDETRDQIQLFRHGFAVFDVDGNPEMVHPPYARTYIDPRIEGGETLLLDPKTGEPFMTPYLNPESGHRYSLNAEERKFIGSVEREAKKMAREAELAAKKAGKNPPKPVDNTVKPAKDKSTVKNEDEDTTVIMSNADSSSKDEEGKVEEKEEVTKKNDDQNPDEEKPAKNEDVKTITDPLTLAQNNLIKAQREAAIQRAQEIEAQKKNLALFNGSAQDESSTKPPANAENEDSLGTQFQNALLWDSNLPGAHMVNGMVGNAGSIANETPGFLSSTWNQLTSTRGGRTTLAIGGGLLAGWLAKDLLFDNSIGKVPYVGGLISIAALVLTAVFSGEAVASVLNKNQAALQSTSPNGGHVPRVKPSDFNNFVPAATSAIVPPNEASANDESHEQEEEALPIAVGETFSAGQVNANGSSFMPPNFSPSETAIHDNNVYSLPTPDRNAAYDHMSPTQ